jgi:hypothetical protein
MIKMYRVQVLDLFGAIGQMASYGAIDFLGGDPVCDVIRSSSENIKFSFEPTRWVRSF